MYRYNFLKNKTHPTELQLIFKEIENVDKHISEAQKFVTWNSEGKKNVPYSANEMYKLCVNAYLKFYILY